MLDVSKYTLETSLFIAYIQDVNSSKVSFATRTIHNDNLYKGFLAGVKLFFVLYVAFIGMVIFFYGN